MEPWLKGRVGAVPFYLLVSGGAVVAFGATGDGAGVGIEGETGAADGVNAGVVTGSSPRAAAPSSEAEGPDDRRVPAAACLVADGL